MYWPVVVAEPALSRLRELRSADEGAARRIAAVLDVLTGEGPELGPPLAHPVSGSRLAHLTELRPGAHHHDGDARLLCVVEPRGTALVLVAADTGDSWSSFYIDGVSTAEVAYAEHTRRSRRARHAADTGRGVAVAWDELRAELFEGEDPGWLDRLAAELRAQNRAHRLAELRQRRHATRVDVAERMGATRERVRDIEEGRVARAELETLTAYVTALGGQLRLVADFGEETVILG